MKWTKQHTFLQMQTSSPKCEPNLLAQLLSRGKNKSVSGGLLEKERKKEAKLMRAVYLLKIK